MFGLVLKAPALCRSNSLTCVVVLCLISIVLFLSLIVVHPGFSGIQYWSSLVGHTCHELFALRTGKIGRLVDIVVWPG